MLPIPTVTIAREELSGAQSSVTLTVDTSNLPFEASLARHLVLSVNARSERAAVTDTLLLELNNDTGTNYNWQTLTGQASSASALRRSDRSDWQIGQVSADSATSGVFGGGEFMIPDAFSTRTHKSLISLSGGVEDILQSVSGRWADTSAITSVTFKVAGGRLLSGSIFEIGVVDERFAIPGAETILI